MWECSRCHGQNKDMAGYCYHCKTATRSEGDGVNVVQDVEVEKDIFLVLSFFIPIVGVILYCMNVRTAKKVAEAYLTWSIMSVCLVAYVAVVVYTGVLFGLIPALSILLSIGAILGATVSAVGGSRIAKHLVAGFFSVTCVLFVVFAYLEIGIYPAIGFAIGLGALLLCALWAIYGGERVLYILSFVIPPVGFIMYAVKRDSAPCVAKKCLTWMAISFALAAQLSAIVAVVALL